MTSPNDAEQAYEVPLVEQLRSIPKDYRTCRAIQWSDDGRETGHQFIPVGHMMHRAADEIDRLRAAPPSSNAPVSATGWIKCSERMPADKAKVLILHEGGAHVMKWVAKDKEFWEEDGSWLMHANAVSHWMPLPSAPVDRTTRSKEQ